ncbi:MAG: tripartite tricarboxylate transporter substrate binding protein [Alphaproteobacteria bacterium]|nr:tripartite tricarboxylate transporter substrate binding protein [Alphaproteobacteria bacterium]
MTLVRRRVLQCAAFAAALLAFSSVVAQTYPTRTVRLVVGFPSGSATDIVARILAQPLSQRLGQQVIVDNKAGAGSNLAAGFVAKAAPDGYTLLGMTITNAVNATLYSGLDFDLARDIVPVVHTFESPNVFAVNPAVPAQTVAEFIAYAKANPGKINYASFGIGSGPHMNGELFQMMTGIKMVHVPYRGNPLTDLISGQVQAIISPMPVTIGAIRGGQLRALAVTSAKPSEALPGVPTVAATVPGFDTGIWHGIGAPKGTPPAVITRLITEIDAILADPATKEQFAKYGGAPVGGTPAEFGTFIAAEIAKWGNVIKTANIKAEPEP